MTHWKLERSNILRVLSGMFRAPHDEIEGVLTSAEDKAVNETETVRPLLKV